MIYETSPLAVAIFLAFVLAVLGLSFWLGSRAKSAGGYFAAHGQIGWNRPFAGAGNYRTPVPGLYLCGGSTHPGGNVTGLCGYNAARVIAADTAKPLWWHPPDLEAAWASLPG